MSHAFDVSAEVKIKSDLFTAFLIVPGLPGALVRRAAAEDRCAEILTEPRTCAELEILAVEDNLLDGPHIVFFD